MKVKRYEPFISFSELGDRFFNLPLSSEKSISGFTPSVNTREDDKAYYIEVDLPGVKKEDVSAIDMFGEIKGIAGESVASVESLEIENILELKDE